MLTVFGYSREFNNKYLIKIPVDIIKTLILFYGKSYQIYAHGKQFKSEWGISQSHSSISKHKYTQLIDMSKLVNDPRSISKAFGSFLIKSQNDIYAAGDNQYGQLGLFDHPGEVTKFTKISFPKLQNDDYVKIISNGQIPFHTLFVTKKNIFYSSGHNQFDN